VSEFFAWMKKLGVNEIRFDVDNNQKDSNKIVRPLLLSQVSDEINKNKNKNGNGGIIAAIVVVGVILAVIIG
ncbi:20243_t:CDS:2, partial [Racocetra persica]